MKNTMLFLCSFVCMTSMAMKPPVQPGQQKPVRSARQILVTPLRLRKKAPERQQQNIQLIYASDSVRDFAQNIIQDPSVDIAITKDPTQIAFAWQYTDSNVLIAYHEDFVDAMVSPSDRSMISKQQFALMIDDQQNRHGAVDRNEMIGVLRRTAVESEIKAITIHEDGHRVYDHVNGVLEKRLESKEISADVYFTEKKKNEQAADNRVYEKGSPRTKIATENFLEKLCTIDSRTGNMNDTYAEHPNGCKRYAAARDAVDKMLGPWADN